MIRFAPEPFQVKFHWHVLDLGMDHVYIKPRTPRLNGKVERSHSTDLQEFYQLLSYRDDVDLEAKLMEWETFYDCHRPHASLKGKMPYEILLEKLQSNPTSTEVISSTLNLICPKTALSRYRLLSCRR